MWDAYLLPSPNFVDWWMKDSFAGSIKKGLSNTGKALALGAAAKAGSDMYDSGIKAVKDMLDSKIQGNSSNGQSNSSNGNNSDNNNKK